MGKKYQQQQQKKSCKSLIYLPSLYRCNKAGSVPIIPIEASTESR